MIMLYEYEKQRKMKLQAEMLSLSILRAVQMDERRHEKGQSDGNSVKDARERDITRMIAAVLT